MSVIEAEDLTRHYGDTVAVDGVSFAVEPGQIFGFLGPTAAGSPPPPECSWGSSRPPRPPSGSSAYPRVAISIASGVGVELLAIPGTGGGGASPGTPDVGTLSLWGIGWILVLAAGSCLVFRRRDL